MRKLFVNSNHIFQFKLVRKGELAKILYAHFNIKTGNNKSHP